MNREHEHFHVGLPGLIRRRLAAIRERLHVLLDLCDSSFDEKALLRLNRQILAKPAIEKCRAHLAPHYQEYINTVSEEAYAMSLEQAGFLLHICNLFAPHCVADLGSGFSSFVLRLYSDHQSVQTFSVDDNQHWLQKSKDFLTAKNLNTDNMELADAFFAATKSRCFDLIYYDLGNMETRQTHLSDVLNLLSRKTDSLLVIDDVHKSVFRNYAIAALREQSLTYYNLRRTTRDRLGRYAFLVVT